MCSCVHSGDLALLRNLMRAGIDVDAVRPARQELSSSLSFILELNRAGHIKYCIEHGLAGLHPSGVRCSEAWWM